MLSNLLNHPSSLGSVNSKANLLNPSVGTLARLSSSNQVHLFSVNQTRAVVPPAFLARQQRLLFSLLPGDRPPLEEVHGIQETPFCQSRLLGVAHPLAQIRNSHKELGWGPRSLDSNLNSSRILGLVVRYLGPLKIKHNNREPFSLDPLFFRQLVHGSGLYLVHPSTKPSH